MRGLAEIQADNERAATRELAELRADTVKGLRRAFDLHGIEGVARLLGEAGIIISLLGPFAADHDCLRPGEETVFPNDRG
ncbi:hypothetical protein LCGC14_0288490 [marine sediment metagenome]|uniref:Uncharacterized protein n=1 Tax=marine sediment metagenome TaxID=412755 RepID=A0A0F9UAN5_9ZZZZ